jgi:hypothetical protein
MPAANEEMTAMRTPRVLAIAFAAVCLLWAVPVLAHHAFAAEYDGTKPLSLKGTVTKVEWVNPHIWIYIDVKGADGKVAEWAVECGAPNALMRRGWRRDSLPIGVEIKVDGYHAKNGKNMANAANFTFSDGRVLFAGSSGTGAPLDSAPDPKP